MKGLCPVCVVVVLQSITWQSFFIFWHLTPLLQQLRQEEECTLNVNITSPTCPSISTRVESEPLYPDTYWIPFSRC